VLYGPGWVPGTGRLGDASTFPEPDPARERFDRHVPGWLQAYLFAHVLLLLVPSVRFAQTHLVLPVLTSLLYSVQLLYALTCVGWLLDGRPWAPLAELLRCCLSLVSLSLLTWLSPAGAAAARLLFAGSLLGWLVLGSAQVGTAWKVVKAKTQ